MTTTELPADTLAAFTEKEQALGRVGGIVAICTWAAGNVMVTQIDLPGPSIAFWRFVFAIVLYGTIMASQRQRVSLANMKRTAFAGIAMGLQIALFFVAIKSTTVATATVIGALQPLLLLGVASRRYNEKVNAFLVGIAVVALTGTALVVSGAADEGVWSLRGDLLAMVATIGFAGFFLLAKEARQVVPALEFQTCVWIWGAITLLPVVLINSRGMDVPTGSTLAWVIVLLLVPGTGHFLINWAHPRTRLSFSSMITLGIPVLSTLGAVVFLDQSIQPLQVVGMVIVIAALVLVVRRDIALQQNQPALQQSQAQ